MQSKVWGLHGAAVICALALGGCIDGPVGQGPTGALGYAGDAAPLSPAAPALRAALTAESTAQADDPPVLAYAPTHAANVPLPPTRPVDVVAGKTAEVNMTPAKK